MMDSNIGKYGIDYLRDNGEYDEAVRLAKNNKGNKSKFYLK